MAALRSGEYAQTNNRLARDVRGRKSYCCEGVAFERYGEALGFQLEWDDITMEPNTFLLKASDPEQHHSVGSTANAPSRFWRVMGLATTEDSDFAFVLPEGWSTQDDEDWLEYATLNDDGFTFSQIADLVEWQFLPCSQVSE